MVVVAVAVRLAGAVRQAGVAVVPQIHMPVVMARHLHGTHRHERQTRTQMAVKLQHGTHPRGRLIHTLLLMVVGLPLGTRPRGRRIPTAAATHHGDQALGVVVHHLHVRRTPVGRLG